MIRRRRRANWPFRGLVLFLLLSAAGYVLLTAGLQALLTPYTVRDLLLPRLVDVFMAAWLFWIGSSIGSFLNVVAWRMPRGRSINGLSHCPWCGHRLAARDNWPVFGWVALRGRCRTCRLPISPRYPIVELVVGLGLMAIGLVELYGGLANLPYITVAQAGQGPMAMPRFSWETIAFTVYHTVAVAGAWALGLVRFDDQRLPGNLVFWVLLMVVAPMLALPQLMVVPWQATVPPEWPQGGHLDALMRVSSGLMCAAVIARAWARYLYPTADLKLDPTGQGSRRLMDLTVMLAVPAVVVGWQAMLGVAVLAVLIAIPLDRYWGLGRDALAWVAISLPVALTGQIVMWWALEQSRLWPGASSGPWAILAWAAVLLIAPLPLKRHPERRDTDLGAGVLSEEPD